ncbi:MAG: hypothetical protein QXP58_09780 [Thermoprotei archaeon]
MQIERTITLSQLDAKLVGGLIEFGPRDLRKLSELLKIPYSKVVYSYKRAYDKLGLRVLAAPNTELLGLTHTFFEVTPSKQYRGVALKALEGISCLNYLAVNANKPTNIFGLLYLPRGPGYDYYLTLFDKLYQEDFLESYNLRNFPEISRYSVRPECVDWHTGEYVFDWDKLTPREPEAKVYDASERPQADRLDLLLLKELESDAALSFPDISMRLFKQLGLKVSDRLLLYHYTKHLVARKMFSKYRVVFSQSGKLGVYLLADTSPSMLTEYREWVTRVPYLNRELVDMSGKHFSEHYMPPKHYTGFLEYVESKLAPLVDSIEIYSSLPGLRSSFSLPYELFDEERGKWMHDPEADAERVLRIAQTLKA